MSDSYEINGAASPLSPVGAKLFGADAAGNVGWVAAEYASQPVRGATPLIGGEITAADFTGSGSGATFEVVTRRGAKAIKVTTAAGGSCEFAVLKCAEAAFFGDMILSYEVESASSVENITTYVGETGYPNYYSQATTISWAINGSSFPGGVLTSRHRLEGYTGYGAWASSPPALPILPTASKVKVLAKTGVVAVVYFYNVSYAVRGSKGRIAVSWDDGYNTAFLMGIPIFSRLGIKQTAAIIPSLVGTAGYCTERQLRQFVEDGGELVAHGPNTSGGVGSLITAYPGNVDGAVADMEASRDWLNSRGLLRGAAGSVYIWPQGAFQSSIFDTALLDAARTAGFLVGRSTSEGSGGFVASVMSANQLLLVPTIGKVWKGSTAAEATDVARVVSAINSAADAAEDVTIMLHRVVPSTTPDGGMSSISTRMSDLITIAAAIKAKIDAGALEAIKCSELLTRSIYATL